jgi:hypothetical protein
MHRVSWKPAFFFHNDLFGYCSVIRSQLRTPYIAREFEGVDGTQIFHQTASDDLEMDIRSFLERIAKLGQTRTTRNKRIVWTSEG